MIPKEKEEVKPLTDQENKLVDSVFKLGQHGTLSEYKNATVEYKDIYKLRPETWLNDEIINFYFALLADRANHDPSMPAIHCFSTFFCSTLREQGYAKVRRWTKRVRKSIDMHNKSDFYCIGRYFFKRLFVCAHQQILSLGAWCH